MPRCPTTETPTQTSLPVPTAGGHPRVLSHKRRRATSPVYCAKLLAEDSASESCSCSTSGESSSDESDEAGSELDEGVEEDDDDDDEGLVAAKRRRRADLDGLKKSVRRMEAQVVGASAQLKDLAALVAQVVAQRQLEWERL